MGPTVIFFLINISVGMYFLTTGTGTGRDIKRIAKLSFSAQMLVLLGILTSK